MRVTVLLFAAHREAAGSGRMEIVLPPGSTVEDAYRYLQSAHRELADLRHFTTFAVNRQVVDASTVLNPGDEIALLQPVSGGAS